jgi:hypothetical protein
MASLTPAQIHTRFRAVLEASPLLLTESRDAFSHNLQPNTVLDGNYYIEDGGIQSSQSVTNYDAVRIDRVTVFVAQKLNFAGATALGALEDRLVAIEKAMIADGPAQSYAIVGTPARRVTRPEGKDYCVGSLTLQVDYDFDEA